MTKKIVLGPATFVTAAFIGPGTITMCIGAGIQEGYSLLWALALATLTTVFIQNIAARVAHSTGMGLAKSALMQFNTPIVKIIFTGLLISAIFLGNAAYEAGNLSGAVLGSQGLLAENTSSNNVLSKILFLGISLLLALILWRGEIQMIKHILVVVVVLMSLCFIITAVLTFPSYEMLLSGFFQPNITSDNIWLIVGLLGTTVVPYNLFLHAALVAESSNMSLADLQRDTLFAVGLGGIVSICILLCAAPFQGEALSSISDVSRALTPLLGEVSTTLMYFGFFAAGFTSALTAPLAASKVVAECMAWSTSEKKTKIVALLVVGSGLGFAFWGGVPMKVIRFAQITNGLLLPIIGGVLLLLVRSFKHRLSTSKFLFIVIGCIVIEVFFIFLFIKTLWLFFK